MPSTKKRGLFGFFSSSKKSEKDEKEKQKKGDEVKHSKGHEKESPSGHARREHHRSKGAAGDGVTPRGVDKKRPSKRRPLNARANGDNEAPKSESNGFPKSRMEAETPSAAVAEREEAPSRKKHRAPDPPAEAAESNHEEAQTAASELRNNSSSRAPKPDDSGKSSSVSETPSERDRRSVRSEDTSSKTVEEQSDVNGVTVLKSEDGSEQENLSQKHEGSVRSSEDGHSQKDNLAKNIRAGSPPLVERSEVDGSDVSSNRSADGSSAARTTDKQSPIPADPKASKDEEEVEVEEVEQEKKFGGMREMSFEQLLVMEAEMAHQSLAEVTKPTSGNEGHTERAKLPKTSTASSSSQKISPSPSASSVTNRWSVQSEFYRSSPSPAATPSDQQPQQPFSSDSGASWSVRSSSDSVGGVGGRRSASPPPPPLPSSQPPPLVPTQPPPVVSPQHQRSSSTTSAAGGGPLPSHEIIHYRPENFSAVLERNRQFGGLSPPRIRRISNPSLRDSTSSLPSSKSMPEPLEKEEAGQSGETLQREYNLLRQLFEQWQQLCSDSNSLKSPHTVKLQSELLEQLKLVQELCAQEGRAGSQPRLTMPLLSSGKKRPLLFNYSFVPPTSLPSSSVTSSAASSPSATAATGSHPAASVKSSSAARSAAAAATSPPSQQQQPPPPQPPPTLQSRKSSAPPPFSASSTSDEHEQIRAFSNKLSATSPAGGGTSSKVAATSDSVASTQKTGGGISNAVASQSPHSYNPLAKTEFTNAPRDGRIGKSSANNSSNFRPNSVPASVVGVSSKSAAHVPESDRFREQSHDASREAERREQRELNEKGWVTSTLRLGAAAKKNDDKEMALLRIQQEIENENRRQVELIRMRNELAAVEAATNAAVAVAVTPQPQQQKAQRSSSVVNSTEKPPSNAIARLSLLMNSGSEKPSSPVHSNANSKKSTGPSVTKAVPSPVAVSNGNSNGFQKPHTAVVWKETKLNGDTGIQDRRHSTPIMPKVVTNSNGVVLDKFSQRNGVPQKPPVNSNGISRNSNGNGVTGGGGKPQLHQITPSQNGKLSSSSSSSSVVRPNSQILEAKPSKQGGGNFYLRRSDEQPVGLKRYHDSEQPTTFRHLKELEHSPPPEILMSKSFSEVPSRSNNAKTGPINNGFAMQYRAKLEAAKSPSVDSSSTSSSYRNHKPAPQPSTTPSSQIAVTVRLQPNGVDALSSAPPQRTSSPVEHHQPGGFLKERRENHGLAGGAFQKASTTTASAHARDDAINGKRSSAAVSNGPLQRTAALSSHLDEPTSGGQFSLPALKKVGAPVERNGFQMGTVLDDKEAAERLHNKPGPSSPPSSSHGVPPPPPPPPPGPPPSVSCLRSAANLTPVSSTSSIPPPPPGPPPLISSLSTPLSNSLASSRSSLLPPNAAEDDESSRRERIRKTLSPMSHIDPAILMAEMKNVHLKPATPVSKVKSSDARDDLLQAIRNAGGIKSLRKTSATA